MPSYHYWSPRGLGDLCCSMCLPCIWCFTYQMPEKSLPRPLIVTTKNVLVPNIAWGTKSLPLRTVCWRRHSTPSSQAPHRPVPTISCPTEISEWVVGCFTALKKVSASSRSLHLPWCFSNLGWEVVFLHLLEYYQFIPCCLLCLLLQLLSHFRRGVFWTLCAAIFALLSAPSAPAQRSLCCLSDTMMSGYGKIIIKCIVNSDQMTLNRGAWNGAQCSLKGEIFLHEYFGIC